MEETKTPKWHLGAFFQEVSVDGKPLPWPSRNTIGPVPLWVESKFKPTVEFLNENISMPDFLANPSKDIKWACIGFFVTGTEGDVDNGDELPPPVIEPPTEPREVSRFHWILDAGHGALTPGKRSPRLKNGKQLLEFEFNRDIVNRISTRLSELNITHTVLVPEVNIGDELPMRVRRANAIKENGQKRIFVSVHGNAHGDGENWAPAKGVETWHFHGSRAGQRIALEFQNKLVRSTRMTDRGLKSRPNAQFYVLRKTNMPSILTENGFYTNLEECNNMLDTGFRNLIADAHVAAIVSLEGDITFNL